MSLQLRHRGLSRCWRWLIAWASWAGFIAAATGELEISVSSLCPSDCVSVSPLLVFNGAHQILSSTTLGRARNLWNTRTKERKPHHAKSRQTKDKKSQIFCIVSLNKRAERSWNVIRDVGDKAENEGRERELVPGRVYKRHLKCNLLSC